MGVRAIILTGLTLVMPIAVSAQNVQVTGTSPPEAKMAVIDHGSPTLPASTVARYARLLDRLDPRCSQNRERIADMVVASREELKKRYRKDFSLLDFLTAAATMMDESTLREQDCAGPFALLVITLGSR